MLPNIIRTFTPAPGRLEVGSVVDHGHEQLQHGLVVGGAARDAEGPLLDGGDQVEQVVRWDVRRGVPEVVQNLQNVSPKQSQMINGNIHSLIYGRIFYS